MSEKTGIEWATHTASPWFGCSKVSPGCTNCYAEQLTLQKKWAGWGDNSPRVRSKGFWKDAYRLNRKAEVSQTMAEGMGENPDHYRPRMFTSLMDWLDPKAPIEWLVDFLKVVYDCQNLDWLLLTKRPEQFQPRMLQAIGCDLRLEKYGKPFNDWLSRWSMPMNWNTGNAPKNVWFGVTCENQDQIVKRWDSLRHIQARIKWASVEPLLEAVYLYGDNDGKVYNYLGEGGFNWIVVGGESGSKRRDCGLLAITNVVGQCIAANVPVFVKQDVGQKPGQQGRIPDDVWALKQFPK